MMKRPVAWIKNDELIWDASGWGERCFISLYTSSNLLCHCVVNLSGRMHFCLLQPEINITGRKIYLHLIDRFDTSIFFPFETKIQGAE